MSYLTYLNDDVFRDLVKSVLIVGINRKREAESKFDKNVIDPFASLFESAAFEVDHKIWRESETIRQCQKTLTNHIGDLHQKILGNVEGWNDLGTGGVVDLICPKRKIIAEVKNKYNTVTGGKLADQYYSLHRLVMPKASQYKGFKSYFVNVIPKKPERYNIIFEPSDRDAGEKCAKNELIRKIDGASFYALVTGNENAIQEFYNSLPNVIEEIFRNDFNKPNFSIPDKDKFSSYFSAAYIKK